MSHIYLKLLLLATLFSVNFVIPRTSNTPCLLPIVYAKNLGCYSLYGLDKKKVSGDRYIARNFPANQKY